MQKQGELVDTTTSEKGDRYLGLRADAAVHERAKSNAAMAGLTVSDYLRALIMDTPLPRRRQISPETKRDVGRLLGQLGKIGGNLNQLSHQANQAALIGNWQAMPEAEQVLIACAELTVLIREVQAEIVAEMGKK